MEMVPTMSNNQKHLKKAKLRHAEYYDMQSVQDALYAQSRQGKKFDNLMELIISKENIIMAYRNLKKNHGSRTAGTDRRTIKDLSHLGNDTLIRLVRRKFDYYRPQPVRRVEIPKDNGKTRPLGIPTILDRLIQQCVLQVLEPICEAKFFDRSNGFRPNRSAENAIAQYYLRIQTMDLHYVLDIDIKGFFDNVNHGKLLKQMWTLGIRDKKLIKIISLMLKAEVAGIGFPTKGTPQGGIISPLLSNIVLNELDWWIASQWEFFPTRYKYKNMCHGSQCKSDMYSALRKNSNLKECYIIRYADDFKILCKKRSDAQKLFIAVQSWLTERLGLDISPEKSKIVNLKRQYSEFLGFKIKVVRNGRKKNGKPKFTVASYMTEKAEAKIKKTMKQLISEIEFSRPGEEVMHVGKINSYVCGVHNYYCIGTRIAKQFQNIAFPFKKSLKIRLSTRLKSKRQLDKKGQKYFFPKYLQKQYGSCQSLVAINGYIMAPLWYMQHRNPMDKPRKVNQYTKEGRAYIHENISSVNMNIVHYLMRHPVMGQSVEYNDNRISLYIAQKGKCAVTGELLEIGQMHCHHIKPREQGGDDRYSNLKYVAEPIHIIIHATRDETIARYRSMINLNSVQMKKLNSLRCKAGNQKLD